MKCINDQENHSIERIIKSKKSEIWLILSAETSVDALWIDKRLNTTHYLSRTILNLLRLKLRLLFNPIDFFDNYILIELSLIFSLYPLY